jgi:LysM repeat protein
MDTISRESSPSYLPIAGLVVGIVGILLGGIALANARKANNAAIAADAKVTEQVARIDSAESAANNANSTAERASSNVASLQRSVQENFNLVATEIGKSNGEIAKLQEAVSKKSAPVKDGAKAPSGPVTAGPDEYVVKSGDTGMKIAAANGVSIGDLQAVNPSVNWKALKVGQKIKLPAKK